MIAGYTGSKNIYLIVIINETQYRDGSCTYRCACTLVSQIETVPNKHTDLIKHTGQKLLFTSFFDRLLSFSLENVPRKHTEEHFF